MSMFLLIYNSPSLVNVRNKSSWRHFLADIAAIVTVYLYCRFAEMNRQLLVPYLPYAANIQPNYWPDYDLRYTNLVKPPNSTSVTKTSRS
jgi:hypothetical protein